MLKFRQSAMVAVNASITSSKDHKSALSIVIPRSICQQIQNLRLERDKGFVRWFPHINLLYPFLADSADNLAKAADVLAGAMKSKAFKVTLREFGYFDHGDSFTMWLSPESEELIKLQAELVDAFPECSDLSQDPSRGITAFRPHMSLGQWRNKAEVEKVKQELEASWEPVQFTVDRVCLLSRAGYIDPFKVRYEVPLGAGAAVGGAREVNVPYVATVGPCSTEGELAARYGIGALQEGVWYFAFGANLSSQKLTGARNISSMESVPGRLDGWRLAFNHRGAMGNIVEDAEASAHGVLYRIKPHDFARLTNMEHEYRPTEVVVAPYDGRPPVRAVAFVSPPEMQIREGMPPSERYLKLLQTGAHEWNLDGTYTAWLDSMPSVDQRARGPDYYTSPEGTAIKGLRRMWTGGDSVDAWGQRQSNGRGGRGGRRGGGGRGRGGARGRGGREHSLEGAWR